jgi:RNA polymerase sigma-70 factor, ECF subfamily
MERTVPLPFARPAPTGASAASGRSLADRLRAAVAGDQEAFEAIYAAYAGMVHSILLGRVPRSDVDDLVQEVFLTAFRRISSLRDHASFGGWLAAIARNRATDFLRQARPESALPEDLPGGPGADVETLIVLDAIRKLPEAYRETLLMRFVHGMTGSEIAERTGMTHGSVRVNLHRGVEQLRALLCGVKKP